MILLLVPVLCALAGLALYGALRLFGVFSGLGFSEVTRSDPWWRGSDRGSGLRDRLDEMPRGCLAAIVTVSGLWVLGWLIILIVGLSLLA